MAANQAWARGGKQFVSVVVGFGGSLPLGGGVMSWSDTGPRVNRSRVLTFALDGKAALPPVPPPAH